MNFEVELEKNQDMIKTFTDNNRRLEKYIHDAKTLKRENLASGKFKSVDFHINGVGGLKSTQSASVLSKQPKIERSEELTSRKQQQVIYLPVKVGRILKNKILNENRMIQ